MKNAIYVDYENNQIIMTTTFAKKAYNASSSEYAQLQSVRRDNPEYKVVTRQIKKNPHMEHYKGLNYDYMRDYIRTHEQEETVQAAIKELDEKIQISKCHSTGYRYPVIKKWFLDKYPDVKNFGVEPVEDTDAEENSKVIDLSAATAPASDNAPVLGKTS